MTNDHSTSTPNGPSDEIRTMVLMAKGDDDLLRIASISDREQRSKSLQEHLEASRRQMIALLERHAHRGIVIVNPMEGSPSIVASGPSAAWIALSSEEASALASIDLVSNDPSWRLPTDVS